MREYKYREYEAEELQPVLEAIGIDGVMFAHTRPGVHHQTITEIKRQFEELCRKMSYIDHYMNFGCNQCGKIMKVVANVSKDEWLCQCENCKSIKTADKLRREE